MNIEKQGSLPARAGCAGSTVHCCPMSMLSGASQGVTRRPKGCWPHGPAGGPADNAARMTHQSSASAHTACVAKPLSPPLILLGCA